MSLLTTSFGRVREAALAALAGLPASDEELEVLSYYARELKAHLSRERYEMGANCIVTGLADLVEG
jgi:hypothetical protein